MSRLRLIAPLMALLGLAVFAPTADAQRGQGRGMRGGAMGAEMMQVMRFPQLLEAAVEHASEVGLEGEETLVALADMKVEVDGVFAPIQERLLAMRSGGRPERGALRSLMQEAQDGLKPHMERFDELVNEEQQEALREFLPPMGRGGGGSR